MTTTSNSAESATAAHPWEELAPPPSSPDAATLTEIVADAALRAASLLSLEQAGEEDPIVDLVRLLHASSTAPAVAQDAAQRAGISTAALNRLRVAHTYGGMEGVRTAHRTHRPAPGLMDDARDTVRRAHNLAADAGAITHNHLTFDANGVQLRLSTEGRWFPYAKAPNGWAPARGQATDPVTAYRAASIARRNRGN